MDNPENKLGEFLRERREGLQLGVRELCRMTDRSTSSGRGISPSYYSQVENNKKLNPEKISMDFLWAVGSVLQVDPLKLFVLCRSNIPRRFEEGEARDRLFKLR